MALGDIFTLTISLDEGSGRYRINYIDHTGGTTGLYGPTTCWQGPEKTITADQARQFAGEIEKLVKQLVDGKLN